MHYENIDRDAMAPCPFCGQQGEYYIEDITDYHMAFHSEYWDLEADEYQYSVECAECNALYYGTASPNREEAIANAVNGWNHRECKEVKMVQTIGEYIEQDARTFWIMGRVRRTYYYYFVDTENDNEEVLIATYYPGIGLLKWEKDKYSRSLAMNEPCEYVDRRSYTYNDGNSVDVDILMYNLPKEEIEAFNV